MGYRVMFPPHYKKFTGTGRTESDLLGGDPIYKSCHGQFLSASAPSPLPPSPRLPSFVPFPHCDVTVTILDGKTFHSHCSEFASTTGCEKKIPCHIKIRLCNSPKRLSHCRERDKTCKGGERVVALSARAVCTQHPNPAEEQRNGQGVRGGRPQALPLS